MRTLTIDIETYSDVDLTKCGVYKYAESDNFEILLLGYAYDDEDVHVIDLTDVAQTIPASLMYDIVGNTDVLKIAHNANFELTCLSRYLQRQLDPHQWLDTAVLSSVCGLPRHLDGVCKALGFTADYAKDARGKALIKLFSCPRKPTKSNPNNRIFSWDEPEKWETYIEYNRQDVIAEREIYKRLCKYTPDKTEHEFWCLDQKINTAGVKVDRKLVEQAIALDEENKAKFTERAVEISGIDNPNSVAQIKEWLKEQEGVDIPTLNKKAMPEVLALMQTDAAKEFLDIRTELSKSSTKKYEAMERSMSSEDDHIRGCFLFYGASRTGRFAGRLVQLQNLKANSMDDLPLARDAVRNTDLDTVKTLFDSTSNTLSELVRTALIPESGHRFVVADFSAIEARVIAWIAEEEWRINAFKNGQDIYCSSATQMFHVPVVKNGENGHLRKKGKIAELACGYGGSVGALKAFGAVELGMTEEDMANTVAMWRTASPHICSLWGEMERAALKCAFTKQTVRTKRKNIAFTYRDGIMWMSLPSGRPIAYYGATCNEDPATGKRSLVYWGQNQTTKKWEKIETWGGKIVENLVQATARDCLREAMLALDKEGWDIRAHVHDEVICTEPITGRSVEEMIQIMTRVPDWAEGLPLNADGYDCDFYFKD